MIPWTPPNLDNSVANLRDEVSGEIECHTNTLLPHSVNLETMKFLYLPRIWLYPYYKRKIGMLKLKELYFRNTEYISNLISNEDVYVIGVNHAVKECKLMPAYQMNYDGLYRNYLVGELDD